MKTVLSALFVLVTIVAFAQPPVSLVIEEVTIPEPELANITADLGATPHTWRIKANIPADYELQIVYGDGTNNMNLSTPGSFYQHPLGGGTTLPFSQATVDAVPELGYDCWLTIGAETSDGNMSQLIPAELLDIWEGGGDLMVNDIVGGGVFITTFGGNPQNTPDVDGNVLIAQITATDEVMGCLNFQIRRLNPDGTIFLPIESYTYSDLCFTLTPPAAPCPGDFDGSGTVNVPDLFILIQQYGCQSLCSADLTSDDKVLFEDFLVFFTLFGTPCN
jgi:hypothetical protein